MLTQQQLLKLVSSLGACLSSTAAKLSDASDRMRSGQILSAEELDLLMQSISDYSAQRRQTLQNLAPIYSNQSSMEELSEAVNRYCGRTGYLQRLQSITTDDAFAPKLAEFQRTAAERLSAAGPDELEGYQIFFALAADPQLSIPDEQLELLSGVFPVSILRALFQGRLHCSDRSIQTDANPPASEQQQVPPSVPEEPELQLSLTLPDGVTLSADGAYLRQDLSIPSVGSFRSVHFNKLLNSEPATRQILTLAAQLIVTTREQLTELLPKMGARRLDDGLLHLVNSGYLEKIRFYIRESDRFRFQNTGSEESKTEYIFYVLANFCINRAGQDTIRRRLLPGFDFLAAQSVHNTLSDSLLSYQRCQWCGEFLLHAAALNSRFQCRLLSQKDTPWCCAEVSHEKTHLLFFPMLLHGTQSNEMLDAAAALLRTHKGLILFASDSYGNAQYWEIELRQSGAPMDRILFADMSTQQLYTPDFHKTSLADLMDIPEQEPDAAKPVDEPPSASEECAAPAAELPQIIETVPIQPLTPEKDALIEPEELAAESEKIPFEQADTPEPENHFIPEAPEAPVEPPAPVVIDAENSIFPSHEPEDFEILPTSLSLFAEQRFDCGLLMLKSACRLNRERYEPHYLRFAYALNDPLERCVYHLDRLQEIYCPNDAQPDSFGALTFCAYLRMLFSEDIRDQVGYEYLIREQNLNSIFSGTLYEIAPDLRSIIYDLCQIFERFHRGFDPYLILLTKEAADSGHRLQEIQNDARSLLEARLDRCITKMTLLADLRALLFGPTGELMGFLRAVLENDKSRVRDIQTFCGRFLRSTAPADSYTEDSFRKTLLGDYIDSVCASLVGYRHDDIVGGPRNSVLNNLCKIMTVCMNWAALHSSGQITDERDLELISKAQLRLSQNLARTEEKLRGYPQPDALSDRAALSCLIHTLHEMHLRVHGEFDRPQEFYLDFLTGEQIELNPETGLPELEESVSIIPGYELWRRVYRHAAEHRTMDSIRAQIYRPDGTCSFDFGRALLYRNYLNSRQLPAGDWDSIEADEQSVLQLLSGWVTKFEANLELADSYGRLEVGNKDRIMTEIEQVYLPHARASGNFGFFRRATAAYLQAVDEAAKQLRAEVLHRLEQLEQSKGQLPITQTIRTLIDDGKYSVASDYIRLADDEGYQQAPADGMLLETGRRDYLSEFLHDYNKLFNQYYSPNTLLERIYSEQHPHNQDHNKQLRSARLFVSNWPKGNTALGGTAELLTQLGFQPSSVEDSGTLVRTVRISPPDCRLSEYAHPIAAFGTRLSETGLQVNYLLGRFSCETLMSRLRGLGTGLRPVLVILDYALTLPERRQLALMLKREGANLRTMLLIDRVLAAYLTRFDIEERGIAMLQCTLPFHYYNPYFENPQAIIPPEMFMGRRQELQAIMESGRCNIIYGGRQLGKTALLHRARYLCDDRANGSWSLYVDIKSDDKDSIASHILRELARPEFGFLSEQPAGTDWQGLSDAIRTRMNDPEQPVSRLLLLLDEADHFLDSSTQDGYLGVETLSALQTLTGDRFKFVLAGLHNVQRFHIHATEHNSKLAHLTSMAIKPLSYADASQLLETPLYYLGFRMKPEQNALISQVLSSCNYYPGLIHFYCSRLISRLSERGSGASGEPPYYLGDDQIRMLIQDKTFSEQIRNKFFITLHVDKQNYYQILSYALACCYHEYPTRAILGFTARDVLEICETCGIHSITELPTASIEALLRELEELNILRCADGHYFFNRRSFRNMLGGKDSVWAALEQYGEESV